MPLIDDEPPEAVLTDAVPKSKELPKRIPQNEGKLIYYYYHGIAVLYDVTKSRRLGERRSALVIGDFESDIAVIKHIHLMKQLRMCGWAVENHDHFDAAKNR